MKANTHGHTGQVVSPAPTMAFVFVWFDFPVGAA
jgi:hypothetical protein